MLRVWGFDYNTRMKPSLVILAAGMGSRYGGLKQLDPMGPSGETMLDFAVIDACRAGFGEVVFVIREDFEAAFRQQVGDRYAGRITVKYCFQALDDLPGPFTCPAEREKPWGTAHAVRAARNAVDVPFAVINADDFYGADAFTRMAAHLREIGNRDQLSIGMIGYRLANTLSPNGSVNRGICKIRRGLLESVTEWTGIQRDADGILRGDDPHGNRRDLDEAVAVSMNFWGFTPSLFTVLEAAFCQFLDERIAEPKAEFYIPTLVDRLIHDGSATCPVIGTDSNWFGVTYPADKPIVQAALQKCIDQGGYPAL